jgi:hypothetical protein
LGSDVNGQDGIHDQSGPFAFTLTLQKMSSKAVYTGGIFAALGTTGTLFNKACLFQGRVYGKDGCE